MESSNKPKKLIDAVLFDFGGVLAEEGWKIREEGILLQAIFTRA